jgi:release factor glutamine methyltransferase
VAVTLAHLRPDASLIATDISTEALQIAERNAARHQSRVNFILSDWYSQINGLFNLIVSNPPYIAAGDPHLSQGDLRFEPSGALTDHADGLQAIDAIITGAAQHLKPGGWLLLEHGYDQAASVRERFEDGAWIEIGHWRDLAGIERVSGARLPLR